MDEKVMKVIQGKDRTEITEAEEKLANDFIEAYKKLCDEHGLIIGVVPTYKQSLDTGDWRLVLQTGVQKIPSK